MNSGKNIKRIATQRGQSNTGLADQLPKAVIGKVGRVCQYCGKQKPDVRERPDGYAQDVHNDRDAVHIACDDCDRECNQDI